MIASTKSGGATMRSVVLSRSALAESLGSLLVASPNAALDLRSDARGLGLADVSAIAHDVGFRHALHSPEQIQHSALAPSTGGHEVVDNWWSGGAQPVVTFLAVVISVKRVAAGSAVSYGYHYTTQAETTLALVSAGFADGVPRSASGRAHVLLAGAISPIAGRIAMDQCVVDVGDVPVSVGDTAVIWGASPSLAQWSEWSRRSEGVLLSHRGDRVVTTWH
jgi:alanine racemase